VTLFAAQHATFDDSPQPLAAEAENLPASWDSAPSSRFPLRVSRGSDWVEFLRATDSPHHLWLREAIKLERPLAEHLD
jgi:hypothetical protein